jgi:hypothetical protein
MVIDYDYGTDVVTEVFSNNTNSFRNLVLIRWQRGCPLNSLNAFRCIISKLQLCIHHDPPPNDIPLPVTL